MTRLFSVAALLCALVALPGCPEETTTVEPDMTVVGDMAMGPDMRVRADSCAGVLACSQACTQANEATCVPACQQAAAMNAMSLQYLGALGACITAKCAVDAGSPCSMGTTSTACRTCVGTSCMAEVAACMAH